MDENAELKWAPEGADWIGQLAKRAFYSMGWGMACVAGRDAQSIREDGTRAA